MSLRRKLESKDKLRYQDGEFDLDLSFITDRIIAMGLPGEKIHCMGRNDIDEVSGFFNKMFPQRYMILNLSGLVYDYSKFESRVREFDFPDHNCPTFELLLKIIEETDRHLKADPANVVAVHCQSERGRTATVIASYLLYDNSFANAKSALDHFATKRTKSGQGVFGPSQIRYVEYFHKLLRGLPYRPNRMLLLKQICVSPIPAIELGHKTKGSCTPAIDIYSNEKLVYSSRTKQSQTFFRETSTDVNLEVGTLVRDDVQVQVYHRAKSPAQFAEIIESCDLLVKGSVAAASKYPYIPLFRYRLHTSFIDNHPCATFTLLKKELDASFEGRGKDKMFPDNMVVSTLFIDLAMLQSEKIPFSPSTSTLRPCTQLSKSNRVLPRRSTIKTTSFE